MVANIPAVAPRRIAHLTSHNDVPATILTYMGVENPLSDYTQGRPLLDETEPPYQFIASWGTAAIVDRQTTTAFGLEAYNADISVLDNTTYQPVANQRAAVASQRTRLVAVLEAMRGFTK
jgi:membrane-anchored protein YejM (alkaline phosphatase superfamily)